MKRVIILGSTGSIGVQALQVVAAGSGLTVVGISCQRNIELLLEQAISLGVEHVAVADPAAVATVSPSLYPEFTIHAGPGGAAELVRRTEADVVLNAIVGFAGLEATIAALETGKTLALANKESLVCAGSLVTRLCAGNLDAILPVDSEHSALFQLIGAAGRETVESVILTASGGPFRGRSADDLLAVGPEEALAHPTWSMGRKISIDSATLANKGLEIIEAHHLFGLPYESIEVVVHPQSVVHAAVRLVDGALLAHLGTADMRVPIAYALNHPQRGPVQVEKLDLVRVGSLQFEAPDVDTFPALRIAREAGRKGDRATCAFNAANEVAVGAFLDGRLPFVGISDVLEQVVATSGEGAFGTYGEAAAVDQEARERAARIIESRPSDRKERT